MVDRRAGFTDGWSHANRRLAVPAKGVAVYLAFHAVLGLTWHLRMSFAVLSGHGRDARCAPLPRLPHPDCRTGLATGAQDEGSAGPVERRRLASPVDTPHRGRELLMTTHARWLVRIDLEIASAHPVWVPDEAGHIHRETQGLAEPCRGCRCRDHGVGRRTRGRPRPSGGSDRRGRTAIAEA